MLRSLCLEGYSSLPIILPSSQIKNMSVQRICLSCRQLILRKNSSRRFFQTSARILAEERTTPAATLSGLSALARTPSFLTVPKSRGAPSAWNTSFLDDLSQSQLVAGVNVNTRNVPPPPHHLHIYATKHNTHITLTKPDRGPLISVSTGNLGFRKAARGTYDAAYQLGAYMMGRIQQQGLMADIHECELVLRGFGAGREALTKVLLGSEGKNFRPRIIRVMDATRLKFGGTRSPKPRRL